MELLLASDFVNLLNELFSSIYFKCFVKESFSERGPANFPQELFDSMLFRCLEIALLAVSDLASLVQELFTSISLRCFEMELPADSDSANFLHELFYRCFSNALRLCCSLLSISPICSMNCSPQYPSCTSKLN